MQLDMFLSETDIIKEELEKQKKELSNVRRGLFARHNELAKVMLELQEELNNIKNFVGYKINPPEIIDLNRYVE